MEKKNVSGHHYIFSQIFQFSLQTEKPGGHSLLGRLLSLFLFESDLNQRGSSFHQVIPTRIKVFRRCKNTENGRSHGCLQGAEQCRSRISWLQRTLPAPSSCCAILLSHKAIYKLWVWSCIFRTWLRCAGHHLSLSNARSSWSTLTCSKQGGSGVLG